MASAAQHGEGRLLPLAQVARPGTPGVLGNLLLTAHEQVGGNFLGLSPTAKAKSTWTREGAEAIPSPPPPPSVPASLLRTTQGIRMGPAAQALPTESLLLPSGRETQMGRR